MLSREVKKELSDEEIFHLLSAAWLHDIGMILVNDEKNLEMNLMDKLNNEIIKEARRLEEDITYSSKSRFNISNFWRYIHGFFGVAIIIGSISLGALSFANLENQFLINLSSLAVIILSILQVFFNPSEKYHVNKNIGDEYNKLRQEIRFFYNFEFYKNDLNANINMIKKFAEEKSKLDYNSSPVPGWIYNRAKKSIEKEEHKYEVDK